LQQLGLLGIGQHGADLFVGRTMRTPKSSSNMA
jgi:hypothetical protein